MERGRIKREGVEGNVLETKIMMGKEGKTGELNALKMSLGGIGLELNGQRMGMSLV